jgi:RHS repeat-associated protein
MANSVTGTTDSVLRRSPRGQGRLDQELVRARRARPATGDDQECQPLIGGSGSVGAAFWKCQARLDLSPSSQALYDLSARLYAPGLGTFTQLDTMLGSAGDPLSLNRYLYAEANPATLTDPTGHMALSYACVDECITFGTPTTTYNIPATTTTQYGTCPGEIWCPTTTSTSSTSSSSSTSYSAYYGETSRAALYSLTLAAPPVLTPNGIDLGAFAAFAGGFVKGGIETAIGLGSCSPFNPFGGAGACVEAALHSTIGPLIDYGLHGDKAVASFLKSTGDFAAMMATADPETRGRGAWQIFFGIEATGLGGRLVGAAAGRVANGVRGSLSGALVRLRGSARGRHGYYG